MDLLDTTGTDPVASNDLAGIVIDVHDQVFPGEYVGLALRYGIAHEVQRAGYIRVDALAKANARIRELEDRVWALDRAAHARDEMEPEDG